MHLIALQSNAYTRFSRCMHLIALQSNAYTRTQGLVRNMSPAEEGICFTILRIVLGVCFTLLRNVKHTPGSIFPEVLCTLEDKNN